MRSSNTHKMLPRLAMLLAFSAPAQASDIASEHREFDATLHVPYVADALATGEQQEARTFTLAFDYPTVERAQDVTWRLELLNASGQVLRRWHGVERLFQRPVDVKIAWSGRADGLTLPDGVYQVRMRAVANDATSKGKASELSEEGVDRVLAAAADDELVEQSWDMALGQAEAPAMPRFAPLATSAIPAIHAKAGAGARVDAVALSAPAPAALPYTVYFGNLHSQTNHSDGGGNLASCVGAQAPQSGAFGPTDAYAYAMNRGLDILMASEHNHMFDGSDSTNTAADPVKAKALYQSGLKAATDFNAAHPAFLAVYGLEWGVINNGGHMNIFNTPELLGWESNASGQLIADTLTPKGDYAGLYTLMRQRGWVGQFNHPATSGQFLVNGVPLGYTADGDDVMTMCEVLNSSAFSVNTTESETGRSNYEGACNKALEAGYHVAFSSDQDNHCANWGASYTNRTGVLIPTGTPLSNSSFIDALKARRVFATMDKSAQLVLTANGHMMGERFSNGGVLNLLANFASASGKTAASVVIYEGVPGRNGTVSQLSVTASTTITPAIGEHFYYAKVTENDGNILWSAPIWVSQSNAADGTAPSVSVAESGAAGNITLSATASDNVGVTMVEFYVDGALKSGTNAAPYVATLNSATLSNGNHSLTARAYDAAGNVGLSGALTFSVNNGGGDTIPPTVSASASGGSGAVTLAATASDNVGVTRVEFSVDNVLKGSSATAPYSLTLAAGVLPAGNHTLTVKAYDAANNSATSSAVNFSVGGTAQQLIVNGGFESGASGWTSSSGVISSDSSEAARAGVYKAWLDGYGAAHTDTLYQQVLIPASATGANLSFWLKVASSDTSTTTAYDTLKVQIRNSSGAVLSTLATYSNLNKGSSYLQKTFDVSAYKGQNIRIYFVGVENSTISTSFLVDDVSLTLP